MLFFADAVDNKDEGGCEEDRSGEDGDPREVEATLGAGDAMP